MKIEIIEKSENEKSEFFFVFLLTQEIEIQVVGQQSVLVVVVVVHTTYN